MSGRDLIGVSCHGQDGACIETFIVAETTAAEGTTDAGDFDCDGRCDPP